MASCEDIARIIDHAVLHPTQTDADMKAACEAARDAGAGTVCIKPYAVKDAVEWLAGSQTKVITVVGFPHGSQATAVKVFEAEQALQSGAAEIDMVINVGKALSGDWDYVRREIRALTEVCHQRGALLKVIIETDYLPNQETKAKLGEICVEAGADFIKTSTGFGFVKQASGGYDYVGATEADIRLLHAVCSPRVQVKASGGVRNLAGVRLMVEAGATRIGASATEAIVAQCKGEAAKEGEGY